MLRFSKLLSTISLGVSLGIGFLFVVALASKTQAQIPQNPPCGPLDYDLGGTPFCWQDNCTDEELCRVLGRYVSGVWKDYCDCV
jgi:hypothetical protein